MHAVGIANYAAYVDFLEVHPGFVVAISLGSVFFGAGSYIGNGPNFMVKAIAEENGVKMPSFFGYMAWSVGILIPIFLLVTLVFFRLPDGGALRVGIADFRTPGGARLEKAGVEPDIRVSAGLEDLESGGRVLMDAAARAALAAPAGGACRPAAA